MTVRICAVTTPAEARRWAILPERLHANKPGYVPALRSTTLAAMNPRRNPFHRHAHISHLLAVRDGVDVGRVSTTVHPAYNERHGASAGFFGFLDAVDDPEVYAALLDAAANEVAPGATAGHAQVDVHAQDGLAASRDPVSVALGKS